MCCLQSWSGAQGSAVNSCTGPPCCGGQVLDSGIFVCIDSQNHSCWKRLTRPSNNVYEMRVPKMSHSEACGEAYSWSRDAWKSPATEGSQDGVSDSSTGFSLLITLWGARKMVIALQMETVTEKLSLMVHFFFSKGLWIQPVTACNHF